MVGSFYDPELESGCAFEGSSLPRRPGRPPDASVHLPPAATSVSDRAHHWGCGGSRGVDWLARGAQRDRIRVSFRTQRRLASRRRSSMNGRDRADNQLPGQVALFRPINEYLMRCTRNGAPSTRRVSSRRCWEPTPRAHSRSPARRRGASGASAVGIRRGGTRGDRDNAHRRPDARRTGRRRARPVVGESTREAYDAARHWRAAKTGHQQGGATSRTSRGAEGFVRKDRVPSRRAPPEGDRAADDALPPRARVGPQRGECDRRRNCGRRRDQRDPYACARPWRVPERLAGNVVGPADGDHRRVRRRDANAYLRSDRRNVRDAQGIAFVAILVAAITSTFVARAAREHKKRKLGEIEASRNGSTPASMISPRGWIGSRRCSRA